ncbi:MMPL family transporter [Catenulispora yoronensis]|uniref:MMPL family transporter n=1 Tax=Catenulispora yoronensis TaxID=450799 RepID=UPI0031D8F2F5
MGQAAATHLRLTLILWATTVIALGALAPQALKSLAGAGWQANGSASVQVRDLVGDHFGGAGSTALQVVVKADRPVSDPAVQSVLARATALLHADSRIGPILAPQASSTISADGKAAIVLAGAATADPNAMVRAADDLKGPLAGLSTSDVQVAATGSSVLWSDFNAANHEAMMHSELMSWPVTLVILVLAFGSLVAAGLPLLLTVSGLAASAGALVLLNHLTPVSIWAMNFAMMFALALGIDYALFLVVRFRAALAKHGNSLRAVGETMDTAGKAVALSGATVLISLSAVMLVPVPAFRSMSAGIMLAVAFVLAATLTLLPAVLAKLGTRVDAGQLPRPRFRSARTQRAISPASTSAPAFISTPATTNGPATTSNPATSGTPATTTSSPATTSTSTPTTSPTFTAWGERLWRHPLRHGLPALALLLALAAPLLGLRTAMPSITVIPEDASARVGYTAVQQSFGPGMPGTLQIITPTAQAEAVRSTTAATPGIAAVTPPIPAADHSGLALLQAVPTVDPSDPALAHTVDRLRATLPEHTLVGGAAVENLDLQSALDAKTPLVLAVVLTLGFLLLLAALRAPLIALVGTLTALLSTAAAFGVSRLVFQDGHGSGLLGFTPQGFLDGWAPVFFFAMVFAIAMDYTVFLLAAAKEHYEVTGDPRRAVTGALGGSGRVIFAAAAVMVAVFFTFALSGPLPPKEMGVVLGIAVLLDAVLVRLVLLPVSLRLLGRAAWACPVWLGRLLPEVRFAH